MKHSMLLVVLSACAATPALHPTVVAGDATPLLEAWATAVGGRDALAKLTAVQTTGTLEFNGMTGEFVLWETARGERRDDESLGTVGHQTVVFDGARGWLVDFNRKVQALDSDDLEDQVALAYLGANAPLLLARRPGRISRDGDALRIEPTGGRPLTVTFDPVSHLPRTIARHDREKTRVVTLSDWRTVGAVRFPFTVRDENGDPRETQVLHVQAIATDRAPPATAFAEPAAGPADFQFAAGGAATMPIELISNLAFVHVRVNGSPPLAFAVDSGASITVINQSRLAALGLTALGDFAAGGGGGNAAMSYVKGVSFALPGIALRDQTVAAVPLDALERRLGHPFDGILGYDFLSRFVVELDYGRTTLTVYDRAHGHHPTGQPVPITLPNLVPTVQATIEVAGQLITGSFIVDTGCGCELSFSAPFTRTHRLIEATPKLVAGDAHGVGGASDEVMGRIAGVAVGGIRVPSPLAAFSRDVVGIGGDPSSAGLIGGGLWKRFVVTFDYDRKTMWLAARAGIEQPTRFVSAGILWTASPEGFTVGAVQDGAPGAEAGLAAGDVLVSVDGVPAAKHTLATLRDLFGQDGVHHAVVVQRGPARRDAVVTPRDLL